MMILCVSLFLLFFILGFGMRHVLPFVAERLGFPMAGALSSMPHVPG